MPNRPPSATTVVLLFVSLLFVLIDCKGFSGSRGSGGFKGGSKGAGSFGGSSSFNRPSAYGPSMVKPSGGGFRKAATSFAAGAAGGVAAYAIMRSMSGSGYRSGYYEPGYGGGATCVNNENINGTVFGTFRCPLNGFDYEDKYCCGERERQYCCARGDRNRFSTGASSVIWIFLIFTLLILLCICWARYRRLKGFYGFLFNRRKQDDVVMVPTEVPAGEPHGPPYYHPAPPPMGYPPPPQVNPYAPPPPQAYPMNYNPYQPPQHPPYNPYQPAPGY